MVGAAVGLRVRRAPKHSITSNPIGMAEAAVDADDRR